MKNESAKNKRRWWFLVIFVSALLLVASAIMYRQHQEREFGDLSRDMQRIQKENDARAKEQNDKLNEGLKSLRDTHDATYGTNKIK